MQNKAILVLFKWITRHETYSGCKRVFCNDVRFVVLLMIRLVLISLFVLHQIWYCLLFAIV